ncbi:MAG: methyl-accepting chemotaxis protein [Actinomycetota bacterium]|nr:methyl-accepting chemotaxis protein [Actinomycetota bacterium]
MIQSSLVEEQNNCFNEEQNSCFNQQIANDKLNALCPIISKYKERQANYKRIVSSVVAKLDSLQNLTEEVFLKIGENLPAIHEDLRGLGNEIENLLEYFSKESGLITNGGKESSGDLDRLNHASEYLIKMASEQGDAFVKMSEMMKRIDNIRSSTEGIREFAVEMEMLSLNAAIVAIKAGESGRTLNPITAELKKMANTSISLIDEIVETSRQLTEKYNLFQELSEKQAYSCKTDAEKISRGLTVNYKVLQNTILMLVDRLQKILEVVKGSKQPIDIIMNTLQVQDILKQCTDHVRLSLEKASSRVDEISGDVQITSIQPDQIFDIISFQEKVPQLCVQLLDDIDERLKDSISDLKGGFGKINDLLQSVSAYSEGKDSSTVNDSLLQEIDHSFKDVEDIVMQTAVMIQNSAQSWDKLWSTALGLETMLEILEKQFTRLRKLTNFHFINIPIKIEVARSADLSKDGELAERVEGLAGYISNEMRQAHRGIMEDYHFLNQMVASMSKYKLDIERDLDAIALNIDELLSNFYRAKEKVKTTFASMCTHVSRLAQLTQVGLDDLERINSLIERNRELKEGFKDLSEMVGDIRDMVASAVGNVDWQLHDGSLRDIVDRFTVLAHKQIAEDLYNLNVEGGSKEGDVVLF